MSKAILYDSERANVLSMSDFFICIFTLVKCTKVKRACLRTRMLLSHTKHTLLPSSFPFWFVQIDVLSQMCEWIFRNFSKHFVENLYCHHINATWNRQIDILFITTILLFRYLLLCASLHPLFHIFYNIYIQTAATKYITEENAYFANIFHFVFTVNNRQKVCAFFFSFQNNSIFRYQFISYFLFIWNIHLNYIICLDLSIYEIFVSFSNFSQNHNNMNLYLFLYFFFNQKMNLSLVNFSFYRNTNNTLPSILSV